MKPITTFAALCALAAVAHGSTTTPVGYETINYSAGYTLFGLRLHGAPVASGDLETISATQVSDTDVADFSALLGASGSATYILEITDGSGIYQLPSTWSGSAIDVAADLTGDVAPGATYTIRPVANLSTVFGAANDVANGGAGLTPGSGSSVGADQVWVPDGSGGYDKYYFDSFAPPTYAAPSWAIIDNSAFGSTAVDGASINLPYPNGFILSTAAAGSLVVTGEVKVDVTEIGFNAGFSFIGSVAPAGATLSTAFGANNEAGLVAGSGSSVGADQIWISNGAGGYNKYYFDSFAPPTYAGPSWAIIDNSAFGSTAVDGSTVPLASCFVISSAGGGQVTQGIPTWNLNP